MREVVNFVIYDLFQMFILTKEMENVFYDVLYHFRKSKFNSKSFSDTLTDRVGF